MANLQAIVMEAACTPSANCWGRYKRVAVVIVDRDALKAEGREIPSSISKHAIGVVRIVATWENCSVGKTERCAYRRALAAAEERAESINAKIAAGEVTHV